MALRDKIFKLSGKLDILTFIFQSQALLTEFYFRIKEVRKVLSFAEETGLIFYRKKKEKSVQQ